MVGAHRHQTLGGISTLIEEILRSPQMAGFDFYHIASQADEYGRFGKLSKLGLALKALAHFALVLLGWRPHLVYVHVGGNRSLYRKAPFIALARLLGRRVLTHFHAGDFEPYYARQGRGGRRLIVRGLGLSHRFIAVSEEAGRLLHRLLPASDVRVVPNGVETAAFAGEKASRSSGEEASNSFADPFVRLLFVGAMGRLKGERDLIRALQRVAAAAPHIRLLMLGRGAETVTDLCRESGLWHLIDHLGPVPASERTAFFKRADLFVLPTYAEGMPLSVIEAMASGLPVVATPVGGIPELIEDGVEGYLVKPGDVEALAERITRLVQDPEERRRLGARAQARARQFDWSVVLARLAAELRSAVGQASLPGMNLEKKDRDTLCGAAR